MRTREDLEAVVEAAGWAPSVHNSQPWSFAIAGDEISLRADVDRRLRAADPEGRELLLSCGAALFNVRTAIRALGFEPLVRTLPDPDRPALLATVRIGPAEAVDEHTEVIRSEIPRRRTHRAGFSGRRVPEHLLDALVGEAEREGARLTPVGAEAAIRIVAALTTAAQEVQAQDRDFSLEMIRWGRPPGSKYRDGVPADAYPQQARRTHPHFAQRDYARGQGWGNPDDQPMATDTGVVALLTTRSDTRADWLRAGQALQAVLLHAAAAGVAAAFHTQALEHPQLRDFIRARLCSGEFPQMVMRLGYPTTRTRGVRRPLADVLDEGGSPG
ncbi:NAD(P)H nitroreductase [Acrocarpospora macrocephala]|uniref:NAD(P)H nitroreductase n=1 Tax=Acrocarpospora macrocephala TaxID=150177 RepID=A0A5M3WQD8_9ACTN|nr:nitroreductase family protein [Acrocarpospora macrocephala]GES11577.1 NAD(P)H nitroreductase [Acrocarpospora macrocephala]